MLDIRRRTGVLLLAISVAHLILISVQVQSKSGVPVLQAGTFGTFARVQGTTSSTLSGVRHFWSNYVWLRGARQENETLKRQVAELEVRDSCHDCLRRCWCRGPPEIRLRNC